MPETPKPERFNPLDEDEQRFCFHFAREGFLEERMVIVERKSRLKAGTGKQFLRRRRVIEELRKQKKLIDVEQARLIARDHDRGAEKEDLQQDVTVKLVEGKLRKLLDLDPVTHGALVHGAIQTALVYAGVVRKGNFERTIPVKDPTGDTGHVAAEGFYQSIFSELRSGPGTLETGEAPAPLDPTDKQARPPAPLSPRAEPSPPPPPPAVSPVTDSTQPEIEIS